MPRSPSSSPPASTRASCVPPPPPCIYLPLRVTFPSGSGPQQFPVLRTVLRTPQGPALTPLPGRPAARSGQGRPRQEVWCPVAGWDFHAAGLAGLQDGLRRRRFSGRGRQRGETGHSGWGCTDCLRRGQDIWVTSAKVGVPTLGGPWPLTRNLQCLLVGLFLA